MVNIWWHTSINKTNCIYTEDKLWWISCQHALGHELLPVSLFHYLLFLPQLMHYSCPHFHVFKAWTKTIKEKKRKKKSHERYHMRTKSRSFGLHIFSITLLLLDSIKSHAWKQKDPNMCSKLNSVPSCWGQRCRKTNSYAILTIHHPMNHKLAIHSKWHN